MLTAKQKYERALALRRAKTSEKASKKIIAEMTEILTAYVAETGDKDFSWSSGLSLTYVSGSPAKETVDAKAFMDAAKKYMTAEAYTACTKEATKMTSERKPSFR